MPSVVVAPGESIRDALTAAGPGGTVTVANGTYATFALTSSDAGSSGLPTTIKSANKWGATIAGDGSGRGIEIGTNCHWVVIDGFQVTGATTGIYSNQSQNLVIKNNWVHHNSLVGIGVYNATSGTVERNKVEYNGGVTSNLNHGIYVYTSGVTVRNNVIRHNTGWGIHAYPNVVALSIYGNVSYDNEYGAILLSAVAGGSTNAIYNNYFGYPRQSGYAVAHLWHCVATDVFVNNVIISGSHPRFSLTGVEAGPTIDYNYCSTADVLNTPHPITDDPMLYDASQNMAWIRSAASSLVGTGNNTYKPAADFWGQTPPTTVQIGAFPYTEHLHPRTMLHDPWDLTKVRRRWWNWRRREQNLRPA